MQQITAKQWLSVSHCFRLFVCLSCPSNCLSVCLSFYLPVSLFVRRAIRPSVCLSVVPSTCFSVRPSSYLSVCLSVRLPARLCVRPSTRLRAVSLFLFLGRKKNWVANLWASRREIASRETSSLSPTRSLLRRSIFVFPRLILRNRNRLLPVYPSTHQSIRLPDCLCVRPSIYSSVCSPVHAASHLSVCLFVHPSTLLSVSSAHLPVSLFVYLPVCSSVHLPVCLFVRPCS